MTTAYVYKLTHKPSLKWYIGSRTRKGCHPDDGYICSSKIVKPLFLSNPDEWTREILFTGNPKEMRELENELLELFDAKNDPRSYNQHNGDGKFTTAGISPNEETKQKMSLAHKGHKRNLGKIMSDETRKIMSLAREGNKNHFFGKTHTEASKQKMREAKTGKIMSEETRKKMSASSKGHKRNLGKTHTEETKQKMSASSKGNKNHFFGKTHTEASKQKMSLAQKGNKNMLGKTLSDETKLKMSISRKGKPLQIITCPHCGKSGGLPQMKRWHFDNCKFKAP